jgi:hypothetical protein
MKLCGRILEQIRDTQRKFLDFPAGYPNFMSKAK